VANMRIVVGRRQLSLHYLGKDIKLSECEISFPISNEADMMITTDDISDFLDGLTYPFENSDIPLNLKIINAYGASMDFPFLSSEGMDQDMYELLCEFLMNQQLFHRFFVQVNDYPTIQMDDE
jgi:hypothetical protein